MYIATYIYMHTNMYMVYNKAKIVSSTSAIVQVIHTVCI